MNRLPTSEELLASAISGLRHAELTGVMIGEEHLVFGANDRARSLLRLDEIPAQGISWVAMTPPEYQGGDDRAIVDAIKYGVSRWFRKEFVVGDGERIGLDLVVIATSTDPFRWIAFLREAGSSPLPVRQSSSQLRRVHPSRSDDAMFRFARRLAGAATLRDVVTAVDRLAAHSLGCAYVNFALATEHDTLRIHHVPSADPLIAERFHEIPLDTSTLLGESLLHDMCAVLTIDELEQRYPTLGTDGRSMGLTHLGAAAMHTEDGRVVGVVGLGWRDEQLVADLDRFQSVADLIGNAIDRASDSELARSMAASFQELLLPAKLAPIVGGELQVRYRAVDRAVGGDFYDVITCADSSTWLVIGDVFGHGLMASRTMAKVRFFLRASVRHRSDPSVVLEVVHDLLKAEDLHELATCLVARWDPVARELTAATAGHLPPIVHSDTAMIVPIPANPPLGVADARFDAGNVVIKIDQPTLVLFYTDGLIERRDEAIDVSIKTLASRLERHADRTLSEIADTLIAQADSNVDDDTALLLLSLVPNCNDVPQ